MELKNRKMKFVILLFLLPALLLYILFQIIPLAAGVFFSFMSWRGIAGSKLEFVGIQNYIQAFQNPDFILALKNMLKMVVFSVLFHTPIALVLAAILHTKCKFYRLFKVLNFVPTIFPLSAVGLMWYFIFMPTGSFNKLLEIAGLSQLTTSWLVNPSTAMNTIVFVNIWAGIGYYMIILLAGMTTIPEDIFEAAVIDGATKVKSFFYITVPLLRPTISVCILIDIIGSVKVFDLVFAITGGGGNRITNLPTTLMYNEAFKYSHYGLGSAVGVIILLICVSGSFLSSKAMSQKEE